MDTIVSRPDGDGLVFVIQLTVAPFATGQVSFAPEVSVTQNSEAVARTLPPLKMNVIATLADNSPLELSPLPRPAEIAGAESVLLRPAIVGGALLASVLVLLAILGLAQVVAGALRRPPVAVDELREAPDLGAAEGLIDSDPVRAYRALALLVRRVLADRYSLPANALTSRELQRRMEANGVDRWQTRLVGGFLEECDAVVYAGYLPAAERRQADLTMAREIVASEEVSGGPPATAFARGAS